MKLEESYWGVVFFAKAGRVLSRIYRMGIWQHIYTVTTTDISPDLEEFTEILHDVNVEMAIIEAVEPLKLHPTSMSYIY